jgi:hypothetical protein
MSRSMTGVAGGCKFICHGCGSAPQPSAVSPAITANASAAARLARPTRPSGIDLVNRSSMSLQPLSGENASFRESRVRLRRPARHPEPLFGERSSERDGPGFAPSGRSRAAARFASARSGGNQGRTLHQSAPERQCGATPRRANIFAASRRTPRQ